MPITNSSDNANNNNNNNNNIVDGEEAEAEAEAKTTTTITYKGYTGGRYNSRLERFEYVDLYQLEARHVPINKQSVRYYQERIREQPLVTSGQDNHIIRLSSREPQYANQGIDYLVVPEKLTARRFFGVPSIDIDQ